MHRITGIIIAVAISQLTAGCATPKMPLPADLAAAPSMEELHSAPTGKCPLSIYRNKTFIGSLAFDIDLPVAHINEVPVGKLRVGQSHCANVKPGRYLITVTMPVFIVGSVEKARAVIEVKPDQPTYLRYSSEIGGLTVIGTGVSVNTKDSLQIVPESAWLSRL